MVFTKQDSLRGSTKRKSVVGREVLSFRRESKPKDSTITGSNTIKYQVVQEYNRMQIDLQNPLEIYKVIQDGVELKYNREGNVFLLN
jgi:hypothetical protein